MVNTRTLFLCLLLGSASNVCFAGPNDPASDATIEQYLSASNAQQLFDNMKQQMSGFINNSMQQAAQGKKLTPERQAIVDQMAQQMSDAMAEFFDWNALKPMYIKVYRESFTQSEMDSIIKFYKTPAGQAVLHKVPVVMQNLLLEMQGMIKPLQQKLLKIQHDAAEKIKATPDP